MQLSSDPVCLSLTVCDGQETVEYKLEDVCHSDGGCDCLPPIQRLSIRWLVVADILPQQHSSVSSVQKKVRGGWH